MTLEYDDDEPKEDTISRQLRAESRVFVVVVGLIGAITGLVVGLLAESAATSQLLILSGTFWAILCLGISVFM